MLEVRLWKIILSSKRIKPVMICEYNLELKWLNDILIQAHML